MGAARAARSAGAAGSAGSRVRRAAAILVLAVVGALGTGAVGVGVTPAGAVDFCSFNVTPASLPPGGGTVTVFGVAPEGSPIFVFVGGVLGAQTTADAVTGEWSVQVFLTATAEITVSADSYPPTTCSIDQVQQAIINVQTGAAARGLPRTGASNLQESVLVGLALVALGTAFVVGMRRRDTLRGRL